MKQRKQKIGQRIWFQRRVCNEVLQKPIQNLNSAKAVVGSVTLNFGLFYDCLLRATIMVLDYQSKFPGTFVNMTVVNNTHICRWNETCAWPSLLASSELSQTLQLTIRQRLRKNLRKGITWVTGRGVAVFTQSWGQTRWPHGGHISGRLTDRRDWDDSKPTSDKSRRGLYSW